MISFRFRASALVENRKEMNTPTTKNRLVFFLALLLMISLACGGNPTVSTQPSSTSVQRQIGNTPESTNTLRPINTLSPPTETLNPNLVNPGTYLVGIDILPGIYKAEGGLDFLDSCYWARLKDLSGSIDAIIANDNSIGQFYIEIQASDYAIETRCELVLLDSLPVSTGNYPQVIKPGTYLVGRDIQSGTYKGQAGNDFSASCYWARLKDVAGGIDAIIANDNAIGQYYVQVTGSDFAFSTACELERIGD